MSRVLAVLSLAVAFGAWGCGRDTGPKGQAPTPAAPAGPSLGSYFAPEPSGVDTAGVRLVPIQTPKGTFKVWTKRFGRNPRIKLLLLHGGPGATHEYFEGLESFLAAEGIEFIYYDQLGSAYSDQPKDESLWTTERFVEEVEQVRQALGLTKDDFYLLGQSWGGILATEYALKYQQHLKGLVISNMMMSIPDYNRYANEVLAKGMDPAVVKEIQELERKGQYESPRYMELLMPNFYMKHICRLEEWPDALVRSFGKLNKQVYVLMQGPSEFGASGRLEKWDRKADLGKITVPTLAIGATHDTMDPEHMRWVSTQVKHGSFLLCPNGSHLAIWDDQRTYAVGARPLPEGRGCRPVLRHLLGGPSCLARIAPSRAAGSSCLRSPARRPSPTPSRRRARSTCASSSTTRRSRAGGWRASRSASRRWRAGPRSPRAGRAPTGAGRRPCRPARTR